MADFTREWQELWQRIAAMQVHGVDESDLLRILGISAEQYLQILAMDGCQEAIRAAEAARFDKVNTINEAWDRVEQWSVARVLQTLHGNPDPDFALRAATLANRADRRGVRNNKQMLPNTQQATAVVHLQFNFAERMAERQVAGRRVIDPDSNESGNGSERLEKPAQKVVDFYDPAHVQSRLEEARGDVLDLLKTNYQLHATS